MSTFEVIPDSEVARLVSFSTGQVTQEAKDGISFKCYSTASDNKNKNMSVSTNINNIEYSGRSDKSTEKFSTDDCSCYVAIQRKGSDKVQIVPAELFRLNPEMEDKKDDEKAASVKDNNFQRFLALTNQFGSGRAKKQANKTLDSQLNDGVLGLMTKSVIDPHTGKSSVTSVEDNSGPAQSSVIPPHNKDAENPEDVYLLETIVPASIMDALKEQAAVFVNCSGNDVSKWEKENTHPKLVLSLLRNLPLKSEDRLWTCALITYLECLMHFYTLKASQLNAKHYPGEWRPPVKKWMEDNFTILTSNEGAIIRRRRCRPMHLKDLVLSHIMILYMRLNDYSIPLDPLLEGLSLDLKRLTLHARTLGFTIASIVDKVAKLKTPFKLPDQRRKRRQKK